MRICATDAASRLSGVPSPSLDATVGAFRWRVRQVSTPSEDRCVRCFGARSQGLRCVRIRAGLKRRGHGNVAVRRAGARNRLYAPEDYLPIFGSQLLMPLFLGLTRPCSCWAPSPRVMSGRRQQR